MAVVVTELERGSVSVRRPPTVLAALMMWAAGAPVKLSMCCRPGPPVQLPQGLSHAFASVEKVQMGIVALIAVGAWALPPSHEPVPAPP